MTKNPGAATSGQRERVRMDRRRFMGAGVSHHTRGRHNIYRKAIVLSRPNAIIPFDLLLISRAAAVVVALCNPSGKPH